MRRLRIRMLDPADRQGEASEFDRRPDPAGVVETDPVPRAEGAAH